MNTSDGDHVARQVKQIGVQRERGDRAPPGAGGDQLGRRRPGLEPARAGLPGRRVTVTRNIAAEPDRRQQPQRARPLRRAPGAAASGAPSASNPARARRRPRRRRRRRPPARSARRARRRGAAIPAAASTSAQSPACVGDAVVRSKRLGILALVESPTLARPLAPCHVPACRLGGRATHDSVS